MAAKNRVIEVLSKTHDVKKRLSNFLGADVGYLAETTGPQEYPNGRNLAENAALHELGFDGIREDGVAMTIPPRPFMRQGSDKFEADNKAIGGVIVRLVEGKVDAEQGSDQLGVLLKNHIQKAIRDGNFVPLDKRTIARKGSSKPLIDDGALRGGVDVRTK